MKSRLKKWLFALLGKDPEAIVVCLRSSDAALSDAIVAEIRRLEPNRRVFEANADEPLRARFRKYRIGLMPVMMPIPSSAWLLAPTKILAYNSRHRTPSPEAVYLHRVLAIPARRGARPHLPPAIQQPDSTAD